MTDRSAIWRSRHGVRRTFQRQQVFGGLTVIDNLRAALDWPGGKPSPGRVLGVSQHRRDKASRDQSRVQEVLDLCGLRDVAEEDAGSLPIGRARMVELARAIVEPPDLLLLDEPTSGLDSRNVSMLSDTIRRVRAEQACTVLVVEHDIGFIMNNSDRVIALAVGEVLADGTPDKVRSNRAVRDAYLG